MTMDELAESFSQALIPVRVAKLLKENQKNLAFEIVRDLFCVDCDDEFSASIEALENICDHFDHDCSEDHSEYFMYFSDQTIMEYYQLCREETRLKKIPFEGSSHVLKAEWAVRRWMEVPGCFYCDHKLEAEPDKSWGCGIRFTYSYEFFEFYPLLERMLGVLDFYTQSLPALRREVDELKRPFAIDPYDPKGAAA